LDRCSGIRIIEVRDSKRTAIEQNRVSKAVRCLRLHVEEGSDRGKSFESGDDGPVSVGTSPDNLLVLTDSTVSRYHIDLRPQERGVAVEDLGSRNGTYIGDVLIQRATVPAGSLLALGRTRLRVAEASRSQQEHEEEIPMLAGVIAVSAAMQQVIRDVAAL